MYKLYEHLLDFGGSITLGLGKDIKNPLLLIGANEPKPEGYRDITSINNLDTWGHKALDADYLKVRKAIVELVKNLAQSNVTNVAYSEVEALALGGTYFSTEGSTVTSGVWQHQPGYYVRYNGESFTKESDLDTGFEFCNIYEKEICLKYSIPSILAMLRYGFDIERIIREGKEHHLAAQATRRERIITASLMIWNIIPFNAAEVRNTCVNPMYGNMYFNYIEFGVEDILDYIEGTGIWEGNGIKQKNWSTTNGKTMEEFANELVTLLR